MSFSATSAITVGLVVVVARLLGFAPFGAFRIAVIGLPFLVLVKRLTGWFLVEVEQVGLASDHSVVAFM